MLNGRVLNERVASSLNSKDGNQLFYKDVNRRKTFLNLG